MGADLGVEPLLPGDPRIVLARYTWPGEGWDVAVHTVAGGGSRVARSRRVGADRRELRHYEWRGGALRALDLTVFHLDGGRFVEAERYRAEGGPNLHPAPIVLPAELSVGESVAPLPGTPARVRLGYAGRVRLTAGPQAVEVDAILLDATDGVVTRVQWLALGVGEIALGDPEGPWERALVGWSGGGASLFGGAPDALLRARYPELPPAAPTATPGGLW